MASEYGNDVRGSAEKMYANGQIIWDPIDRWNGYKRAKIDSFGRASTTDMLHDKSTWLNAGSGSDAYCWIPKSAVNSDLFFNQVSHLPNAVVSDVCSLPFADKTFDVVVCVGSVLNYVPALEAIAELGRVLQKDGYIILHYESSTSFEHFGRKYWRNAVARVQTPNSGRMDQLWVYAPKFIESALRACSLEIQRRSAFHIMSAVAYRCGMSQDTAAAYSRFDEMLQWLGWFADDQIIIAKKIS